MRDSRRFEKKVMYVPAVLKGPGPTRAESGRQSSDPVWTHLADSFHPAEALSLVLE